MNIDKLLLVYCQDTIQAAPAVRSVHKRLETYFCVVEIVDKLFQVNDNVFVAKGYEHIWTFSSHRLKWVFVVFLLMWKHVRTCVPLATPLTGPHLVVRKCTQSPNYF